MEPEPDKSKTKKKHEPMAGIHDQPSAKPDPSLPISVSLKQVLEEEKQEILKRQNGARERLEPSLRPTEKLEDCLGLAFSGGGIRSATLNLGILQGLARLGILSRVDYLSTVSGGGYIGSWLHGVIKRCGGMRQAIDLLKRPDVVPHKDSGHDPIAFLRKFSSYLAPDLGLFSADFWVIFVIWFRNIGLNQLMLIPAVAAAISALLGIGLLRYAAEYQSAGLLLNPALWMVVFGLLLVIVVVIAVRMRHVLVEPNCDDAKRPLKGGIKLVMVIAAILFGASAMVASSSKGLLAWGPGADLFAWLPPNWFLPAIMTAFLWLWFGLLQLGIGCPKRSGSWPGHIAKFVSFALAAAIAVAGLTYGAMYWIATWESAGEGSWHVIAWGPPVVSIAWMIGVAFHIGLLGVDMQDFGREWISRLGALLAIIAISWAALFATMVFGPFWIAQLTLAHGLTASSAVGAWLLTTMGGLLAGKSSKTSGNPDQQSSSSALDLVGKIAPVVFLIGYFVGVSTLVHFAIEGFSQGLCANCVAPAAASGSPAVQVQVSGVEANSQVQITYKGSTAAPKWVQWMEPFAAKYWCLLEAQTAQKENQIPAQGSAPILFLLCGAFALWMNRRIDINEFSMHHFYRNRLVRCYMGASRGTLRRPIPLTGFDPCDDLRFHDLRPSRGYQGPYAIINSTINLNTGSEMAKRERKGTAFAFTPCFTGYVPPEPAEEDMLGGADYRAIPAYVRTEEFAYPGGPHIGTCFAISGAAANPNWGASTSAPLAFLLTVFDVRLGWWGGNTYSKYTGHGPRYAPYAAEPGPKYSLAPLVSELFANTDARSHFVNLSDGGHFENLAIYELVRRRCRFIIAGDGEEDHNYVFESLGGMVRKCRTDFGVEVDIDPRYIRPKDGLSRTHCVVGTIRYPKTEHAEAMEGKLLYLKASLTGDEPEDVEQYKSGHDAFPQETTADQFFTESQFESYRKLGLHIALKAFQDVALNDRKLETATREVETKLASESKWLEDVFNSLYRFWYPPTEVAEGSASRLADEYSKLINRLNEESLCHLLPQIVRPHGKALTYSVPEAEAQPAAALDKKKVDRETYLYCLNLIQLMENVWSDLGMREEANRLSPSNEGWINVFKYWVRQPIFIKTWRESRETYNQLFQHFYHLMGGE